MTRMVCLGDSFTEGMSDDLRSDGRHLGWADRVAVALARAGHPDYPGPIEYANLAVRGKLLDQVIAEQVPAGLAMQPQLLTFHAGPNDVLRPGTGVPNLLARYGRTVQTLRQSGATVVLFTCVPRTGGSGPIADRVATRLVEFNAGVRSTARRFDCVLVDNARVLALTDRRLWAADRIHLNDQGHQRVAGHVLAKLGVRDPALNGGGASWWEARLPEDTRSKREALATDARWVSRHLLPWIVRRIRGVSSGDGIDPKDPHLRTVLSPAPAPQLSDSHPGSSQPPG
jgi:lysophospholipase L1-like esterase